MLDAPLPLHACPTVINLGLSVHGRNPVERYRLPRLWCLHAYRYRATLELDGTRHEIHPGSVSIVPPDVPLVYRFRGRSEHVFAHFYFEPHATTPREPALVAQVQQPHDFPRIEASLREAIGWWPRAATRVRARLWDVLWQLADRAEVGSPQDAVDRLTAEIERRLGTPLTVQDLLADLALPYSHNHLLRLFRERTGTSIVGHIRARRCERAARLLRHTSLPIKVIAAEVGVPDPHAFNKLIRAVLGQSPTQLRHDAPR
ncbi:MAG: AraC family transcriptional regulator [Planctomycetota bacterium]